MRIELTEKERRLIVFVLKEYRNKFNDECLGKVMCEDSGIVFDVMDLKRKVEKCEIREKEMPTLDEILKRL